MLFQKQFIKFKYKIFKLLKDHHLCKFLKNIAVLVNFSCCHIVDVVNNNRPELFNKNDPWNNTYLSKGVLTVKLCTKKQMRYRGSPIPSNVLT